MLLTTLEICIAFALGSIPFGIIVCHHLGLESPQEYGSRNIGATNVARQDRVAGLLTLLLDMSKGYIALSFLRPYPMVVLAVVAGHCFSPLLNYRGGKGVATLFGAMLAYKASLAATLTMVWGLTFSRYQISAIASVAAAGVLLLYALISKDIALSLTACIVLLRHKDNFFSS